MKLTLIHKILSFSAISKAISFKKGTLSLLSLPLSIGFFEFNSRIFEKVSFNEIAIPILSTVICIFLYFIFFIADLGWGLLASKKEEKDNPDWITSEKLYGSLGKIGGVLLINTLMLFIIIFLLIINFKNVSLGFLIISTMLNILAILYELHSIGENIKRTTGKKPSYLEFFDKITTLLETKIIGKIDKIL